MEAECRLPSQKADANSNLSDETRLLRILMVCISQNHLNHAPSKFKNCTISDYKYLQDYKKHKTFSKNNFSQSILTATRLAVKKRLLSSTAQVDKLEINNSLLNNSWLRL